MKKSKHFIILALAVLALIIVATGLNGRNKSGQALANTSLEEAIEQLESSENIVDEASKDSFLVLVNKQNFLPKDYVPKDLMKLYGYVKGGIISLKNASVSLNKTALDALILLVQAANKQGVKDAHVTNGYRSYETQKSLFDSKVNSYISGSKMSKDEAVVATSKSIASPGSSEHQTGLAIDFGTTVSTTYATTNDKKWYDWLAKNAYKYGFILRYPSDKVSVTGYVYEPWHYRYVGVEHATKMYKENLTLEEYLKKYY